MHGHKRIDFYFKDTATTEIYTLSLHDALPICGRRWESAGVGGSWREMAGDGRRRQERQWERQWESVGETAGETAGDQVIHFSTTH